MRFFSLLALIAAISACESTPKNDRRDLSKDVKEQEEGLSEDRNTDEFTQERPIPKVSERDRADFVRIWELFRARSPAWPAARDAYKERNEGAAYWLSGHVLRYYMRANANRGLNKNDFLRARDEVIAVGAPCAPYLVDLMVLDKIQSKRLGTITGKGDFITDDLTRQDCVYILGEIGSPSVSLIARAVHRKDAGFKARRYCAMALGETRSPKALPTLVTLMREDESWQVRADAAAALGVLGDARALEPLLETIRTDDDPFVVRQAGKARTILMGGSRRR